MAERGTISINAENIMPVIKKWLYSDKDIFVRELVSNGCDAVSKMKRLISMGEASLAPEEGEAPWRIDVVADAEKGTLTFTDNGIGMTAEEVKKYIAQVAFSGAEEFLKKYKPEDGESGIIGHFGLGFYSAFMVSKKVVIDTKSYQEGAQAVRWTSEDGMQYDLEDSDRAARGTSITLYLNDEDKEFANLWTLRSTLEKHCQFMPVPIYVSEVKAPKEGEEEKEAPAPEQINDTSPLWLKRPADVTDEEYREFYHKVFHDYDEPLFWIHLNAEYPFNLKGILYFPKLKNEFTANEGVIKLYNNQVFVADNIKEVIPEFLMLLKGVIDCPDLPLERFALVFAERRLCEEDGGLHHPQGGRPPALRVQQPPRGLSEVLGRHPSLRQVRLHTRREVLRARQARAFVQDLGGRLHDARGVQEQGLPRRGNYRLLCQRRKAPGADDPPLHGAGQGRRAARHAD